MTGSERRAFAFAIRSIPSRSRSTSIAESRRAALYVVPGGGHSPVFLAEQSAFADRALRFLRDGIGA